MTPHTALSWTWAHEMHTAVRHIPHLWQASPVPWAGKEPDASVEPTPLIEGATLPRSIQSLWSQTGWKIIYGYYYILNRQTNGLGIDPYEMATIQIKELSI
jgi:hypothetical protein